VPSILLTGDWDPFLGTLDRARAEAEMTKRGEEGWLTKETYDPRASLGYPLSVFDEDYTLKVNVSRSMEYL